MKDYKDLVKSNAIFKLNELIRYLHFDYNDICSFLNEKRCEYFTSEELNELSITIDDIIKSQKRFDTYCRNLGLM